MDSWEPKWRIRVKPANVKSNTHIQYAAEYNPKLKVADHVRRSKYKNIFANNYWEVLFNQKFKKISYDHHTLRVVKCKPKRIQDSKSDQEKR